MASANIGTIREKDATNYAIRKLSWIYFSGTLNAAARSFAAEGGAKLVPAKAKGESKR